MVQPKQQKQKSKKKPPHVNKKQHGKIVNMSEFRSQLDALGLKIIEVTADGNCFFRSLAEQLDANEEEHSKYRNMVVQYILNHQEDFEPFIEDGVPFDDYCKSMEKDGTWAGNMELQAASLVTGSNICIHRRPLNAPLLKHAFIFLYVTHKNKWLIVDLPRILNLDYAQDVLLQIREPRWYIRNFPDESRVIHLSYHNEEHYNSVRVKEDYCDGPARSIVIKVDSALTPASKEAKGAPKLKEGRPECSTYADPVKMVMSGSGCQNIIKVEQILQLVDDDVDAAIEFLIAERGFADNDAEDDGYLINEIYGHWENGACERTEATTNHTSKHDSLTRKDKISNCDDKSMRRIDKNIPRNHWCPCGSKKKYKECCASDNGSSSEHVNHNVGSKKVKVKTKNKKGGPTKVAPSDRYEENLPDMGALCI